MSFRVPERSGVPGSEAEPGEVRAEGSHRVDRGELDPSNVILVGCHNMRWYLCRRIGKYWK